MPHPTRCLLAFVALLLAPGRTFAAPAIEVLGRDYVFPQAIEGMPARLSDFRGLQINRFTTSDDVELAWWEAGSGSPIVIIPGGGANGAEYVNVMWLLSQHHRVLVLDPRGQGLSEHPDYGYRIARFAADLREFNQAAGVGEADYVGHSMGAAVLWSYIDLYGTQGMRKLVFIDEPIAILSQPGWSAEERLEAGAMADTYEQLQEAARPKPDGSDWITRQLKEDTTPYFINSQTFADMVVTRKPSGLVGWDHAKNDWRDVIAHKIDRPTILFTGARSDHVPSQRWAQRQIAGAELYVYSEAEHGDHLLMYKNPVKFVADLSHFLARP